jgi:hypothetical protein
MNLFPPHVAQSREWGTFKEKMGTPPVRVGNLQYTLHKVPFIGKNVGYCPKPSPSNLELNSLYQSGRENGCTHIKIDVPNTDEGYQPRTTNFQLLPTKPTFATSTFLLDLERSEEDILKAMHSKTRYNIGLADKKGVQVEESEDIGSFINLQKETAKNQGFFVHPDRYYQTLWETLRPYQMIHLLIAKYKGETLAAWVFFKYKDTFYYPYGASSNKYREVMASSLIMWEGIKLGKHLGCKVFDMWGAADDPENSSDPWHGFTRFKSGFGATHLRYPGSWDLVIDPIAYRLFKLADATPLEITKPKEVIMNTFEDYLEKLAEHEVETAFERLPDPRDRILVAAGVKLNWLGDYFGNDKIRWELQNIPVENIQFTGGPQRWNKILLEECERSVEKFKKLMTDRPEVKKLFESEASFSEEPIIVRHDFEKTGNYKILDGLHRFVGALLQDREEIASYVPHNESEHRPVLEPHVIYDLIRGYLRSDRDGLAKERLLLALQLLAETYDNVLPLLKERFNENYIFADDVQEITRKITQT